MRMSTMQSSRTAGQVLVLLVVLSSAATAQSVEPSLSIPESGIAQAAVPEAPSDPWADRPVCASMFLKTDWQLTPKQRACNWLQNGVLSSSRMFSTAWSTGFSMVTDQSSERGDGFRVRYGRKWVQGALATTAEYLGSELGREDPRGNPPYLVLRGKSEPRGFFPRFGEAIKRTVVTTKCVDHCGTDKDIRKRFRLSRLFGAVASGAGGALMTWDEPDRFERAWHGAATAYATSFGHSIVSEFKPELTAAGGSLLRRLGIR